MKPIRHLLVRASAGTGKTYQLTSRYLALLLGGADADRILATTFTRKAAHEIHDRVVARLAAAARGGSALELLGAEVGREVTAGESLELLSGLLRGMDRMHVSTIDAFFARLARLFALDLGLPPAWRIADEAESETLRSDAVADAVEGADEEELLALLRDHRAQAIGHGAHEDLMRFVAAGRQALLESRAQAWERIRPPADVAAEVLEEAKAKLRRMPLPRTKAGTENKRWANAAAELAARIDEGDWLGVLGSTLVKKVVAGEVEYAQVPIDSAQREVLRPLASHAVHVAFVRLARQNRASRALLDRHEEKYRALGRRRGILGFEDLPAALAPVSGTDPLAERGVDPAHRLDGRIDHLLLDEFQDTSPVQWRVLRPMSEGILRERSGLQSFFCVGDEKQSIYGWRAAEPRLLLEFDRERPELAVEKLERSWRSSRAVLETVNAVFEKLDTNPAFKDSKGEERTAAVEAAKEFLRSFSPHESAHARGEEPPGTVHLLSAGAPEEGQASHAPAIALAVERARGILAEAPRATVGILLRRRRWIPELIHALREAGIAASDEGGNPLTDSVAVLQALSMLHLADHPGDLAAALHVATSPFGKKIGLTPEDVSGDRRPKVAAVSAEVRASLARLGYGGYLASIRPTAGEGAGAWDVERFGQLIDLALAWEARSSSRPRMFVEHARKTKVEDPSAEQVRVMTVHGAKGLEFDAVILPELDVELGVVRDELLTMRPEPEGEIEIVTHRMGKEISAAHEELERVRADVARRRMVEELCVLYVAMTRARQRLDLIVQTPGGSEDGAEEKVGGRLTCAAILRGAIGARDRPSGGAPLPIPVEGASALAEAAEPRPRPLRFAPSRRARSLRTVAPSRAGEAEPVPAARLLRPTEAITARGRLMHRWLAEIEWIETFDRSDQDLLAIGRRMEGDEGLLESTLAEFRAALTRPQMRRLLSRPKGDAEVWRERPFALRVEGHDGRETLWTGAIDRATILRDGDQPSSAEIVDFKTDRIGGLAVPNQVLAAYQAQLDAYRIAVERMSGVGRQRTRVTLLFLDGDVALTV
jgi:ATP-dependent helicase/nuclease subunit A